MTDEINNDDGIKKWDVHFRGSDKVLCVDAETSPLALVNIVGWLEMRNGGMINLAHVLAIVPHVEPADAAPSAPDTRPHLRDAANDIWMPVPGTDMWRCEDTEMRRNRTYIEFNYGPVTEIRD